MSKPKLKHSIDEHDGNHTFDYQNVRVKLSLVDGDDIGSEGGLRFRMFFKRAVGGETEAQQVDEFVIYPDAIDWENGGKMKPEFQKRIEELQEENMKPQEHPLQVPDAPEPEPESTTEEEETVEEQDA